MTSQAQSQTAFDLSGIVDETNIDATDVTLPLEESAASIDEARTTLSISPTDTHIKHLSDGLVAGDGIEILHQNIGGDETLRLDLNTELLMRRTLLPQSTYDVLEHFNTPTPGAPSGWGLTGTGTSNGDVVFDTDTTVKNAFWARLKPNTSVNIHQTLNDPIHDIDGNDWVMQAYFDSVFVYENGNSNHFTATINTVEGSSITCYFRYRNGGPQLRVQQKDLPSSFTTHFEGNLTFFNAVQIKKIGSAFQFYAGTRSVWNHVATVSKPNNFTLKGIALGGFNPVSATLDAELAIDLFNYRVL